jgi:hypothetical protein
VRWLAAALKLGLMQITANNWVIHKGASKLAHSKGFASDKKYAALSVPLAHAAETSARPGSRVSDFIELGRSSGKSSPETGWGIQNHYRNPKISCKMLASARFRVLSLQFQLPVWETARFKPSAAPVLIGVPDVRDGRHPVQRDKRYLSALDLDAKCAGVFGTELPAASNGSIG